MQAFAADMVRALVQTSASAMQIIQVQRVSTGYVRDVPVMMLWSVPDMVHAQIHLLVPVIMDTRVPIVVLCIAMH